jgi:hypothetical protein
MQVANSSALAFAAVMTASLADTSGGAAAGGGRAAV